MTNIKNILSTPGWKEIEGILEKHINNLRLPKNVSKKKNYQDIAIETLGKAYAVRVWERWIKDIKKPENKIEKPKPFI